jgi:hypothetical protein
MDGVNDGCGAHKFLPDHAVPEVDLHQQWWTKLSPLPGAFAMCFQTQPDTDIPLRWLIHEANGPVSGPHTAWPLLGLCAVPLRCDAARSQEYRAECAIPPSADRRPPYQSRIGRADESRWL